MDCVCCSMRAFQSCAEEGTLTSTKLENLAKPGGRLKKHWHSEMHESCVEKLMILAERRKRKGDGRKSKKNRRSDGGALFRRCFLLACV